MDTKDHLPEVMAWKEEVNQYFASKRLPKQEFYHNPDFIAPRNRSQMRNNDCQFDPVLNRFIRESKDKEYDKLYSSSLTKKKAVDVPASKGTNFNIITMIDAPEEKIRKSIKLPQSPFNIITNENANRPFQMFMGKKRVAPKHESSTFNILTNFPTIKTDQSSNQSKVTNKQDIFRIHRFSDFDPIRGIYKDINNEMANRRMETEVNEQKKRRKYEILPPSQKYAFSPMGNFEKEQTNLASMNFTGATNDPFTKLRISKKHSFERRTREQDEASYDFNERRKLQKFNKSQNVHLKKPLRNPILPDTFSNNKVEFQAAKPFRL